MTNIIQVEYDQLSKIAQQFSDAAEHFEDLLRSVNQQSETLKSSWIGENAESFFKDFERDTVPALQRLTNGLQSSAETARTIITVMSEAEEGGSAALRSSAEGSSLFDKLMAGGLKGSEALLKLGLTKLGGMISGPLARKFMDLVGTSGDDMANLKAMLSTQSAFSKAFSKLGGGALGGIFDYVEGAMSGKHEWSDMGELGKQVTSGLIQGGIALIPGGQVVVVGDMVVQVGATLLASGTDWVGQQLGVDLSPVSGAITSFKEAVSLDRIVDGGVNWVVDNGPKLVNDTVSGIKNFFGF